MPAYPSRVDEALVVLLVSSLFFQRLDYSLWLHHVLPLPDVSFVVIGCATVARVAFIVRRGGLDLGVFRRREATVLAFVGVIGVTSVAAAVLGASEGSRMGSYPFQSLKTYAHLCFLVLIALVIARTFTIGLLRRALFVFFVLAASASLLAIVQALDENVLHVGAAHALGLVSRQTGGFVRPCSIFSEPAYLGYFALLGAVAGLWLQETLHSVWIRFGLLLCVLGILLAASAGPVVALVPVALYIAWRATSILRRLWPSLVAMAVTGIAVLVFLPSGPTLVNRMSAILSGSDASAAFRYAHDAASIKIWELSPVVGVGLGNTRYYLPSLVHLSFMPNATFEFQSVNAYLGLLEETGVFGLLALAAMMLALLVPVRRRDRSGWMTEACILVFAVAFFFIGGLAMPMFWFWVGVRLAFCAELHHRTLATAEAPTARNPAVVA